MAAQALLLLLAAALQSASPVEPLIGKIDGKDGRASYRALTELVALGPEHRKDLEAGAAKLPDFYREALLSELRLRDELGELYGRELRVTLKGGTQAATAHLAELDKASGMRIEPGHQLRRGGGGESVELAAGSRTAVEALAEICEKVNHIPYVYGNGVIVLNQHQNEVKPFVHRNFAVFVNNVSLWKKSDFSGSSLWRVQVGCTPIADSGVRFASWKGDFRLIEALTDKGVRLEAAPKEAPSAVRHSDEPGGKKVQQRGMTGFQVSLTLPKAAPEKIARLRGVTTVLLAKTVREFPFAALAPLDKARVEDEEFEVALVDNEGGQQYQPEFTLSIRPKKMKLEELADLPIRTEVRYKGLGEGQSWSEVKTTDKAVEIRVRWWPVDWTGFRGGRENRPEMESLKVSIPQGFAERPLYLELSDIPLK